LKLPLEVEPTNDKAKKISFGKKTGQHDGKKSMECKTVYYEHQSQNLNKIIVNNGVQMSVGESCSEGIQVRIVFDHRPLTVFAEDATGMVDVNSGGTGGLLGWSGIFSISFFASSHAFKF
jgi:hypothetical protein